ncbi:MAG: hypothetical protein J6B37_06105 [Clostridia bacterium]|nr:hypothetical protein [Clostridia bacterium]
MDKWRFLYDFQKTFDFDLSVESDTAVLTNHNTGVHIEIFEDKHLTKDMKESFVEYRVCFSTQHRHFEDLGKVEKYVRLILTDEILPTEFYYNGERRFGGEITKADYEDLNIEHLAELFGYTVEYLSQFDFEVSSWSGKYNIERN